MDLEKLRERVEAEVRDYVYSVPEGALGRPLSAEWVTQQLAEMSASLVQPRWVQVATRDTHLQMRKSQPELRASIQVADDGEGHHLYFDPVAGDFFLAYAGTPPESFNVRGDAVGCFMAR